MSRKETPLAETTRRFGSKDKLVDSLVKNLDNDDEDDGALKQRLLAASNTKLLRLADALDEVNEKHGGKDKLIAAICEAKGKAKDSDFIAKLGTYSHVQLLDVMSSAGNTKSRRARK